MPRKPPKRPRAEDIVRDYDAQRAGHSSSSSDKKPRFDARNPSTLEQADEENAPDGDVDAAILDLDEIGRAGTQTKRNAVRLEGYESDSSNEGFDRRAVERARAKNAAAKADKGKEKDEDDDDDMFAEAEADLAEDDDEDDDEETATSKKQRKEVRFMNTGDIEGQVASSRGGGHVSADFRASSDQGGKDKKGKGKARNADDENDSDTSSVDDEERDRTEGVDAELGAGSKKSRAPKLDAFNMRNEAEEGRFDESGNFVRNAVDPFAVHDAWMEGNSSRVDMKKAREAHEKREMQRRRRDVADDAVSTSEILASLIRRLEVGETVLEALARYGSASKKVKPRWQTKKKNTKKNNDMEVDDNTNGTGREHDAEDQERKEAVESITAAADLLLTRGQEEVYEAERELLMRQYKRETGEDWLDERASAAVVTAGGDEHDDEPEATKQWEYQWADARDGGEVHGPYDSTTMASWQAAGYFGEGVQFRQAGSQLWRDAVPEFV